MRLMIAMVFVALGSVGTAHAQKIDCQKIVSNCTGSQSLAKFGSPLACLKRAPAPIQHACASIISKYNMCASKCDKGTRGSLCRSKCGSVAKTNGKPRGARPVLKKPIVRKAGPSLKRPMGKPVRPMAKPKTGKYQGTKSSPVKRSKSKVRPMAKPKTGKYQGTKSSPVKRSKSKVRPMAKPKTGKYQGTKSSPVKRSKSKVRPIAKSKTGKYQGTKGRSVSRPNTGVRKAPIVKSKKPYSPKKGIKLQSGPHKKSIRASAKPAQRSTGKSIRISPSKADALNKNSKNTAVKKNYKVKKRLPVKKVAPRPAPRKAADTTGASKAKKRPSVKSLRSKSRNVRGLKKKSGKFKGARLAKPKRKSKVRSRKTTTNNVGQCKKDSRGRLVCKPVKSKRPASKK
jgi:hypothetical protein